MNIKNRIYTYPVLSNETDDFVSSKFEVSYKLHNEGVMSLNLLFDCKLNNSELIKLIEEKKAKLCAHIECSLTSFRKMIDLKANNICEYNIDLKKVNGKIELLGLIIATENICNYYSSDFNPDYNNASFFIEKGSILAYYNLGFITINKNIQEFKSVESIFSITKLQSEEDTPFSIDLDGDKIKIGLPQKQFDVYNNNCYNSKLQTIFNSMLILPSLIYTFEILCSDESYKDKTWYLALDYNFKQMGRNLSNDIDSINNYELTSYELAQIIMDYPIKSAFESISLIEEGEDSDED